MSSNTPEGLHFHQDHVWLKPLEQSNEAYLGVSNFAQKQLGQVVFVDLPQVGTVLEVGIPFGAVESNKVVSDLIAPVSGVVLELNNKLRTTANLINEDCYGNGWIVKIGINDPADLTTLLPASAYKEMWEG